MVIQWISPTMGCFRNGIPLPDDSRTLAHYFAEAGYETGYIGKWHLHQGSQGPVPRGKRYGYEFWLASNVLEFTSDAYRTILFDEHDDAVELPGYRVDAVTDAAIRYIDAHKRAPFFLFLSYIEPHHQNHLDDFPPPEGYRQRYTGAWMPPDLAALGGTTHQHLAGYYGMVKRLDEAFGRLMDALLSLHLVDDTIVLFTSDHGCHFKTRNGEYKRSCHDSSIRVPTILAGPGFRGGVSQWPEEVFVQISEAQVGRAVRTQRWKYGVDAPDQAGNATPGSELYVEQYLYDLQVDPYELRNLIGLESHDEVATIMRARLLRRMVEAGERRARVEPSPLRSSGQRWVEAAEPHT